MPYTFDAPAIPTIDSGVMNRRTFISKAIAAVTVAPLWQFSAKASSHSPPSKNLLERFVKKFKLQATDCYWSDSSFTLLYSEKSKCFKENAYHLADDRIYSLPESNSVMIPLALTIPDLGCIDWGFLFFEKCLEGHWHYVKAFNKHESEALLNLESTVFGNLSPIELSRLLLPTYQKQGQPNSYTTQKGRVEIEIKLCSANIQSKITVWDDQQLYSSAAIVKKVPEYFSN